MTGDLDVSLLERTLNNIVQRHESMRTTFGDVEGVPFQRISPKIPFSLSVTHLETLSSSTRETRLQELLKSEVLRRFDLKKGPLFHFHLIKLTRDRHIFSIFFTMLFPTVGLLTYF